MITPQLTYNYPLEIFDNVSYYLTHKQKGICRNVCKSWRSLFTPSQYRHVQIRGRRQFQRFYGALMTSMVGHYVRRLSIDDVCITAEELETLPTLCPNLVHLLSNGVDTSQDISFSQWSHLRYLTEYGHLTVANQLLRSPDSTFSSLTNLSIRFSSPNMKHELFDNLHKASDLECLSLDTVTLSLSDLEMIHDSCRSLQKLRLINADLEPISFTLKEKRNVGAAASHHLYKPTKCMKILEFQNGGSLYDNYEWLYYFASKYNGLVSLHLWCRYSVSTPSPKVPPTVSELEERYAAIASIGVNCRSLKYVNLINVTMNHWFFEAMDHVGISLDSIALGDMTDRTLDMLQCLVRSKQNVCSLTLWGWPSLCIQETMQEAVTLIGMCSDRLYSIDFSMQFSGIKNAPIPIDFILSHCSKLKRLKFDNIQAVVMTPMNTKTDDDACYNMPAKSSLEHLIFKNGSFRNQVFDYLSIYCPNLTNLEVNSCSLIGQHYPEMDIKIHMPHHTFQSIRIDHARSPSHYYHAKQAIDIRLFNVYQYKKNKRQLFELNDYEPYTTSLDFEYEQRTVEYSRPTNYIGHHADTQISGPFVSITCQDLAELHIGTLWAI
ncbi:hypothetical protein INT47_011448 [Mucor saturninus]|uniref:F-box domain-containing protein n=1 Tax=Mucor saturninus TaxID=64648 RepID=A0A8H7V228_9FUNG|nr:hypothetical protein INT47_011448 [Mucor saturninus]